MKAHQNVIIDGVDIGDAEVRKNSKFCNEGKWENFIKPLLPKAQDMTFIEYGSNAGLFLRLAKESGFRRVIGIERNQRDNQAARAYRDELGLDYRIIEEEIGPNFEFAALPMADVTLLANFHYHQHVNDFRKTLNSLESKSRYVLVVSANVKKPHWRAQPYRDDLLHYFRHWELIDEVSLTDSDDPHPREMFSLIFKSRKLDSLRLRDIDAGEGRERTALSEFVKVCLEGGDIFSTRHYGYQKRRRRWKEETLKNYILEKCRLVRSVAENGITEPVIVDRHFKLVDGLHRYLTLEYLGYKNVIVRIF